MTMQEMNSIVIPETLTGTVTKSLNILRKQESRKKQKRVFWTVGGLAAAVVLVLLVFTAYPALAENIPFLRGIFAEKQESYIVPGSFAESAEVLNPLVIEPESSEEAEAGAVMTAEEYIQGKQYAVASSGFALIPSEVYCDGISVFVSLECYSEKSIQELSGHEEAAGGNLDLLFGNVRINGKELHLAQVTCHNFDAVDNHRFAGIAKIDLTGAELQEKDEYELSFHLAHIWGIVTDANMKAYWNEKNLMDFTFVQSGSWKITLPIVIDTESVRVFSDLNPDNEPNRVDEVRISPYQIQVFYQQKNHNNDIQCCVYDENGERLLLGSLGTYAEGHDVFSLDGATPQKLYIYIVDTRGEIFGSKIYTPEMAEEYKLSMIELDLVE